MKRILARAIGEITIRANPWFGSPVVVQGRLFIHNEGARAICVAGEDSLI